jgi:uncharacterized alpha/beta hydrolase family protein
MKKMILLVVMLTLVAFVSGVMAQQKPAPEKPAAAPAPAPKPAPPAKMEKFSGAIEKVDEMAKAIDVKGKVKKEPKTLTFATDDKTKITKGKETLSFADLKNGMHVSVEYKKDGDKMVAVAIKASAPKAAPKK